MSAPPRPNYRKTLPPVLMREDVARLFGVDVKVVRRWDAALHPFRTPGGHRRWNRDTVLDAYEALLMERQP